MKHLSLCLSILFFSCNPVSNPSSDAYEEDFELSPIYPVAKANCSGCHDFPSPKDLNKETWEKYILPRMGNILGKYSHDSIRTEFLDPDVAQLNDDDWESIQEFYLEYAPDRLEYQEEDLFPEGATDSSSIFIPRIPKFRLSPPSTSFVRIDPGNGLLIGDIFTQSLYKFDSKLNLQQIAQVGEGAISLNASPNFTLITLIGSFSPTDLPSGKVIFFPNVPGQRPFTILDSLQRPVHSSMADMNQDGRNDLIISEFAKWEGGLSWWENLGDNFKEHPLKPIPGAIKTVIRDFNGDQLPDIMALFGQGNEGIYRFINKGNKSFSEEKVLSFPPSYGSSFFDLIDFNGDGKEDIIYTCGDNADYPPIIKPYHGIRIFQQMDKQGYEEVFFFPFPGAYAAIVRDFDEDGDQDIAAISFFPDFERHERKSFIYLENNGSQEFTPHYFDEAIQGRWLVMDAEDIDGDKDFDIVLGSLTFEVVGDTSRVNKWIANGIPFLILENKLKNKASN